MAADASRDIALALNGLTRFMINPPEIEESLSVSRAAQVCLLLESPRQAPRFLNRFVIESRKKREPKKCIPTKKGSWKT
jgi:hypothetical protein